MIGADRQFRIDTYENKTSTRPVSLPNLELADVYELLKHEETDCVLADGTPGCRGKQCPKKDGLAWTPGFLGDPCRCGSKQPATKAKRCPECFKQTRFASNVQGLDLAVYDIDHISQVQSEEMAQSLVASGLAFYLHTTHNHTPPNDQNFRLVIPLDRTITPQEWKQVRPALIRMLKLPTLDKHGVDDATRDPARLAFFPRALRGRPYLNGPQAGTIASVEAILRENLHHSREVLRTPRTEVLQPDGVDLKDLRGFLRRYKSEEHDSSFPDEYQKAALVHRILAEEPLATKGHRGFSVYRAGSILGALMPLYTLPEIALEILRPSLSAMETFDDDKQEENSVEAWMIAAQRGYEGGQAFIEEQQVSKKNAEGMLAAIIKRKREEKNGVHSNGVQIGPPQVFGPPIGPPMIALGPPVLLGPPQVALGPPSPFAQTQALLASIAPPPPPRPTAPSDRDDDGDWRLEKMINAVDKQGRSHPKNTFANVVAVLEHHRAWKGVLRYNEISNEPEAEGGPIPTAKREPERLITAVRTWLAHHEELEMPRGEVQDAIEFVARANRYDPVSTYLLGLTYDDQRRIDSWLIDYCGARVIDDNGLDVTRYVKLVGKKWLMAAAARALYPGCKADNVLVFEGQQYAGKSMALDILGGEWFIDNQLNLNDKSTLELTAKSWIIELSELDSMRKTETASQKAFFSKRKDNFRLSYARRVARYLRRCVFAGTTNETQYLLDLTGNRRFWCVWCTKIDVEALRRDRDQLWAEAVAQVRAGETCPNCHGIDRRCAEHRWWLDDDETAFAEKVASTRLKGELADVIRGWWLGKEPKERQRFVGAAAILRDALNLTVDKLESQQVSIGRAMKTLGFVKTRLRTPGGREWVYEAPPELLAAEKWVLNPTMFQQMAAKAKIGPPPVANQIPPEVTQ